MLSEVEDLETKGLKGSAYLIDVGLSPETFIAGVQDSYLKAEVTTSASSKKIRLDQALVKMKALFTSSHKKGNSVIFIGNGGSAAIASHLAIDFTKNGGIRARAFNDSAALTCMANDFGYFQVFAKQLEYYARKGDVVVLISSSGKSKNILEAAAQCLNMGLSLVTFTGMDSNNPLRGMGDLNFFVPANDYGLIEIAHLSLLHTITSIPDLFAR